MRSVNIFKGTDLGFPVRIEFWDTDKLVEVLEVKKIYQHDKIARFIMGD